MRDTALQQCNSFAGFHDYLRQLFSVAVHRVLTDFIILCSCLLIVSLNVCKQPRKKAVFPLFSRHQLYK
jgi:hypothetical protein